MPRITENIDRALFRLANRNNTAGRVVLIMVTVYLCGAASGAGVAVRVRALLLMLTWLKRLMCSHRYVLFDQVTSPGELA